MCVLLAAMQLTVHSHTNSKYKRAKVVPEGQCAAIQALDIHTVHSCTCISYDYYNYCEWVSKLHISKMECVYHTESMLPLISFPEMSRGAYF